MLAVERESLQTLVRAIRHDQNSRVPTSIYPQAVRAIQLAGSFAGSPEGSDELSVLVVLVDVAGTVAVTNVEVTVWSNRHIGWLVIDPPVVAILVVRTRFDRISQREDLRARAIPLLRIPF